MQREAAPVAGAGWTYVRLAGGANAHKIETALMEERCTKERIPMDHWLRKLRPFLLVAASSAALGASATPASAGILVNSESAANCTKQVLEQPFKRWLDYFNYTLVPGGDFEAKSPSWSLSGAKVVSGNETFYVRSAKDSRSLSLGKSGSAQSRPVCVSIDYPVLRFFAINRGLLTSALTVEVLFEDSLGNVHAVLIGTVTGTSSWQPMLPIPVIANLLALLPGEKTAVAFRFRATGLGGDWRIDDVFVDPHRRS